MTNKSNESPELQVNDAELELRAQNLAAHIEAKYFSKKNSRPCVGLVWQLTGAKPHMAVDEIREMRESITDILVFLCDPEISKKFAEARGQNYYSRHFAKHLQRILDFLIDAKDKNVLAEIALFDLKEFGHDDQDLERLESDFCE
jgi:hypothetical protein